jgi:hypothetical protein
MVATPKSVIATAQSAAGVGKRVSTDAKNITIIVGSAVVEDTPILLGSYGSLIIEHQGFRYTRS